MHLGAQFDDTDARVPRFALVYVPKRKRDRVPENCVTLVESEAAARDGADPERGIFAAAVIGPSRSSEGMRVFYVAKWV